MVTKFKLGRSLVGEGCPTYFIADIAANHDNDLDRAFMLIDRCAQAGADAVKFQNFKANTIVSDHGFRSLKSFKSHQSEWKESVYQTYDKVALSIEWTQLLKEKCDSCGIDYLTAPYDIEILDHLRPFVCAWKLGSGDITWLELINLLSRDSKPLLIATGASTIENVRSAMSVASQNNNEIVLMQCNTNYTGSLENFKFVNLNVLNLYRKEFPSAVLGLSDHTPGHATVLGAIVLGAKVIEKHFTDDTSRPGPDHKFSMDPHTWLDMVSRARELENSLGDGLKRIEDNELETSVLQRRALRTSTDLLAGTILTKDNVIPLRPCPENGLDPSQIDRILGRKLTRDLCNGELLTSADFC